MPAPIVLLTGTIGSGKTSVATALCARLPRAVHLDLDTFYDFIVSGYIEPWLPASQRQNETIRDAQIGAACAYVEGGYPVVAAGYTQPWSRAEWRRIFGDPLRIVVLTVAVDEAVRRVAARVDQPLPEDVVRLAHGQFANADDLVVETTGRALDDVVDEVWSLTRFNEV